jgi:hypothetical protein
LRAASIAAGAIRATWAIDCSRDSVEMLTAAIADPVWSWMTAATQRMPGSFSSSSSA